MTHFRKEKNYWNDRYLSGGNSGYGSYGDQLQFKLDRICPLDFETITEVGCGDFNFGAHILLRHPAKYIGLDISQEVIRINKECFPHSFRIFYGEIPPADLILCVDVLFHILEDEECEKLLESLKDAWKKYLVITAYERVDENVSPHVKIRKFDPSRFGTPIVKEIVEEDGSLFLYIFKK